MLVVNLDPSLLSAIGSPSLNIFLFAHQILKIMFILTSDMSFDCINHLSHLEIGSQMLTKRKLFDMSFSKEAYKFVKVPVRERETNRVARHSS